MSFLADSETNLYFGSYTPYWGTCTLSLDNVYCFSGALKASEVYSLYLSETGTAHNGFVNEFDTMPSLYSGACGLCAESHGKNGVLYIASGSCNSDIVMYSGGSQISDNTVIMSGETVTVEYIGNRTVKGWLLVNNSGETLSTGGASDTFTFSASESSYVICQLEVWSVGDLNRSGDIELGDYILLRSYLENEELNPLDDEQMLIADMEPDGAVDAFDLFALDKTLNSLA